MPDARRSCPQLFRSRSGDAVGSHPPLLDIPGVRVKIWHQRHAQRVVEAFWMNDGVGVQRFFPGAVALPNVVFLLWAHQWLFGVSPLGVA